MCFGYFDHVYCINRAFSINTFTYFPFKLTLDMVAIIKRMSKLNLSLVKGENEFVSFDILLMLVWKNIIIHTVSFIMRSHEQNSTLLFLCSLIG